MHCEICNSVYCELCILQCFLMWITHFHGVRNSVPTLDQPSLFFSTSTHILWSLCSILMRIITAERPWYKSWLPPSSFCDRSTLLYCNNSGLVNKALLSHPLLLYWCLFHFYSKREVIPSSVIIKLLLNVSEPDALIFIRSLKWNSNIYLPPPAINKPMVTHPAALPCAHKDHLPLFPDVPRFCHLPIPPQPKVLWSFR